MGRNLVVARVGANSLHPCWIDRGKPRDWDLYLAPYQDIPAQAGIDCEVGPTVPGPKWSGVREALNSWDGWRDYEYVWIPDDDIYANQDTISRMFEVAGALDLDLFAPALHESSHFAHFITMVNRRFYARRVGFVEIMIPGFRTAALEQLLGTLDLSETGWGWGLDSLWPKLLDYEGVGIIDGTPVIHTRPVGQMRDAELAQRVLDESDRILSDNDCRQMHVTYGGFGPDLAPLPLTPEQLLVEVVEGSRYLYERDPRVLAWIMDFQRGSPPPDYPTAGTPEDAVELTTSI
ncbi:MAG TPA: hypothetical protein VGO83_01055 [Thermoleophilaceae bacterium]|jgi:hypothetical protein|nr:hypothetical protein [Thermoleophilaceae bacterium]